MHLTLIRHGQSVWNREERFTGWTDIDLTESGVEQARQAARLLRREGVQPGVVYTSLLRRSIRTAWTMLEELDRLWIPVRPTWRLNERHYGEMEGHNWNEMIRQRGEEWWDRWRSDYSQRPAPLAADDARHPRHDPRYARIPAHALRAGESVHDIMARIEPVFRGEILAALEGGESVLVSAHGIAIRAIDEMIRSGEGERLREVPNAAPVIYECRGGRPVAASRRVVALRAAPAGGPDGVG